MTKISKATNGNSHSRVANVPEAAGTTGILPVGVLPKRNLDQPRQARSLSYRDAHRRRNILGVLACVVLLASIGLMARPVFAAGLTVSGAKLVATVAPGDTFTHRITAGIGKADAPVDIGVTVSPMLQALDGSPRPSQGTGAYSAVDFIKLDRTSLHLDPGDTETVMVTVSVPEDVGDGGRYALITVASQAPAGGGLSVISGVDIPVYITIKGSRLEREGSLTGVSGLIAGKVINLSASLDNTGNHDFRFRTVFTVEDSEGMTFAEADTGLSLWTLIPGMSRTVSAAASPQADMQPGSYRISCQTILEDGTVVAEATGDLKLISALSAAPAGAPPAVPSTPITAQTKAASSPSQAGRSDGGALVVGGDGRTNMPALVLGIGAAAGAIILAVYLVVGERTRGPAPAELVVASGQTRRSAPAGAMGPRIAPLLSTAGAKGASMMGRVAEVARQSLVRGNAALDSGRAQVVERVRMRPLSPGRRGGAKANVARVNTLAPFAATASDQELAITYSSVVGDRIGAGYRTDKASPGYIFIVVTMTIENLGNHSRRLHPGLDFFAVIDRVKYSAAKVLRLDNPLPSEIDVPSRGGVMSGEMAFEVPARLAGFDMMYDGLSAYPVRWVGNGVEQRAIAAYGCSAASMTGGADAGAAKSIVVAHSVAEREQIGMGALPDIAAPGHVFLVADIAIENRGYESFKVYPRVNTFMVIDNVSYGAAFAEGLENMLPQEMDILDGGRVYGRLAFQVPADIAGKPRRLRFETSGKYSYRQAEGEE